jgi:hypothetical protein
MKHAVSRLALLAAAMAIPGAPAATAARPPAEWSQAAIDDLHFIRAMIRENHPGPVDPENPTFRDWFVRGFDEALALARRADSFAGYFFAIQRYGVGFQDGHLGAMADDRFQDAARLARRWPGFLLGLEGNRFRVVETSLGRPPLGAELQGCDGRSAEALADERLRPFYNLWTVRGARPRQAPFLLIDEGNPFVPLPASCTFAVGGEARAFALDWRPIANAELAPKVVAAQGRARIETGIRPFGRNGWWISLASFNANEDSAAEPLLALIRRMEEQPEAFRGSEIIVFDVRGNSGGNSEFGNRIARALWGPGFVDGAPRTRAVDWRLSTANLRQIERSNLPALRQRFGEEDPRGRAYAEFAAAFRSALERGDVFYRETAAPPAERASPEPVRARIFLLTDGWCGSACLDFADLVLAAPGTVQVGAETSADTVYIDNSGARLPSGEGALGWSMKVHRGRPRGHNQSYVPAHLWTGAMSDTPGLERWIAGLARRR